MNVDFVTIVWGEDFLRLFTQTCLPSQLSENNRRVLAHPGCRYIVYSDSVGIGWIEQSRAYRTAVSCGINVVLRELEHPGVGVQNVKKYHTVSEIHSRCLQDCQTEGRYFSWLIPDGVYPDGFFSALESAVERGYKVVLGPWLRVQSLQFQSALHDVFVEQFGEQLSEELDCSASNLVALALANLHPISQSLFFGSRPSSTYPSCIYFALANGLLAKHFHLHPLLIKPTDENAAKINGTIDAAGYFDELDLKDIDYLIPDHSHDCLWFIELSPSEHQLTQGIDDIELDALKLAGWARRCASPLQQRLFFKTNFVFAADSAQPIDATTLGDNVYNRVLSIVEHSSPLLLEVDRLKKELDTQRIDTNSQLQETRKLRDLFKEQRNNYKTQRDNFAEKLLLLEKKTIDMELKQAEIRRLSIEIEKISEESLRLKEENIRLQKTLNSNYFMAKLRRFFSKS